MPSDPGIEREFAPHLPLVRSVCAQVLTHAGDIDDAVQETYLKFAAGRDTIHSNPASWLHSCARTTAIDIARRAQRSDRRHRDLEQVGEVAARDDGGGTASASESMAIRLCLAQLPAEDRSMLESYFFDDRTLEEIARESGMSISGVKKRLDKTLATVRERLARRGIVVTALALAVGDLRAEQPAVAAPAAIARGVGEHAAPALAQPSMPIHRLGWRISAWTSVVAATAAVALIAWRPALRAHAVDAGAPAVVIPARASQSPAADARGGGWRTVGGLPGTRRGASLIVDVAALGAARPEATTFASRWLPEGREFGPRTYGAVARTAAAPTAAIPVTLSLTMRIPHDDHGHNVIASVQDTGAASDWGMVTVYYDRVDRSLVAAWGETSAPAADLFATPTGSDADGAAGDHGLLWLATRASEEDDRLDLDPFALLVRPSQPGAVLHRRLLAEVGPGDHRIAIEVADTSVVVRLAGATVLERAIAGAGGIEACVLLHVPPDCGSTTAEIADLGLSPAPAR
ncbi:MAG TPA: sigma-70 family RNA polymerase sigma factor [Planctomycetota bacterium]|nr:sigma-70 family RNA polymerase sigma factor [Planctomycetota bacterium]